MTVPNACADSPYAPVFAAPEPQGHPAGHPKLHARGLSLRVIGQTMLKKRHMPFDAKGWLVQALATLLTSPNMWRGKREARGSTLSWLRGR